MGTAIRALAILALGLTSCRSSDSEEKPADWVLTNGKIATQTEEGLVEAIALRDGLVQAIGANEDIRAFQGTTTRTIDLQGRTVIPGLNDSHSHVVRGGRFYNLELRWDGVPTLRDGLERIRRQAQRTPPGQWVRVIGGWSPFQFEERRMPTIAELNEAAPDTPVFVLFLYSKGFLNRAGVEALGLTPGSPAPPGSRYSFVDGGAELIANPNPTLLYKTIGALPPMTEEQQVNSTLQFYRELNRFGLTSAIDAGGGGHQFPGNYVASEQLAEEGRLPLRISFFLFPQHPGKELRDFQNWTDSYTADENRDRGNHRGYVLEGGGEFLVWSAGDFENFLAPRPELKANAETELEAVARHLVQSRWPFRIHATYGESIERLLDVFERVNQDTPFSGLRWVIDHAETIRPDQIPRIQALGGGIAVQNRMAFAGEYFLDRYGKEVTAQAPPLRRLLGSRIPLGAGTDATRVSSHNPWLSLYWMVAGKTVGGTTLYPQEHRLTRAEALSLFTEGSAWVSGEEDRKGALRPGAFADLAVLNKDYFEVPEEEIRHIESVLTMVAGEPVYGAGPYENLCPELPPVEPAWSPVAEFGGAYSQPE